MIAARRVEDFCNTVAGEFLDLVLGEVSRSMVVSFGPTLVPPGETVTLQTCPQMWFKAERLVCSETVEPVPDLVVPAHYEVVKPARWWRKAVKRVVEERRTPQPQPPPTGGLYIQGIFVGQRAQLPTLANPISLSVFSASNNEIVFDTCAPALYITLQVANLSKHPRTFSASLRGSTIQKRHVSLFKHVSPFRH